MSTENNNNEEPIIDLMYTGTSNFDEAEYLK